MATTACPEVPEKSGLSYSSQTHHTRAHYFCHSQLVQKVQVTNMQLPCQSLSGNVDPFALTGAGGRDPQPSSASHSNTAGAALLCGGLECHRHPATTTKRFGIPTVLEAATSTSAWPLSVAPHQPARRDYGPPRGCTATPAF